MAVQQQTKLAQETAEMAAQEQNNLAKEKCQMAGRQQSNVAAAYFAVYFSKEGDPLYFRGPKKSKKGVSEIKGAISGDALPTVGIAAPELGEIIPLQRNAKPGKGDEKTVPIPIDPFKGEAEREALPYFINGQRRNKPENDNAPLDGNLRCRIVNGIWKCKQTSDGGAIDGGGPWRYINGQRFFEATSDNVAAYDRMRCRYINGHWVCRPI